MGRILVLRTKYEYRTAKGGVKVHASLDERYMVPDIVNITAAKVSDRRGVDHFRYPKDTIVVDDRGYFDCKLFKQRVDDENWFVCRIKDNTLYEVMSERELPDDDDQHVLLDEEIRLTGKPAKETGMNHVRLRRIVAYIEKDNRTVVLITNTCALLVLCTSTRARSARQHGLEGIYNRRTLQKKVGN